MQLPEKLQSLRPKTVLIIYAALILIFYFRIFQTYFQSDEWHFFQVFLPYTHSWLAVLRSGIDVVMYPDRFIIPHATPLSIIFWTASMKLFGLHVSPHFFLSLALHILNSYLLFLFTVRFTRNTLISFCAGLFFALSANQFQSVVWIGTYLITSTAVTFTLIGCIALIEHLERKKSIVLFAISTIAALLTKESTLLIIPVSIGLILMHHFQSHEHEQKRMIKSVWFKQHMEIIRQLIQLPALQFLGILTVLYIPLRIIAAMVFVNHLVRAPTLDAADPAFAPALVLFRLMTYPIKMLTQLFLPYPLVPPVVEFLTPFAYQTYGAEKAVRGTNFLLFTQSAGIDLLIYPLAAVFITGLVIMLMRKHDPYKSLLIFGLLIIVLGSWPLIMVASFAPAAAYVAFFDSRHMYLPAIGGGLLFGYLIHTAHQRWRDIHPGGMFKLSRAAISATILILWSGIQFFSLQSLILPYTQSGRDRRELTSVIMQEVKKQKKSGIFYIKSDSVYYGYGDLMPPFETNFGQVLTVYLNQAGLLPDSFLDTRYLLLKGLNGQGTKKQEKEIFGYYINSAKMITAMEKHHISPERVYAFEWRGKDHSARVITDEVREQLKQKLQERKQYTEWKKITIPELAFEMRIPPDAKITSQDIKDHPTLQKQYRLQTATSRFDIQMVRRIFHVGIYEDVSLMQNADGEMIGENFYYRTINMKDDTTTLAKIPSKGNHLIYFLPALMPETIIQIDIADHTPQDTNNGHTELEEIISLMRYAVGE